jgi:uncharacterized coiled-coil protein SlyX
MLEVRQASQRKSLQGLDNTAAEGSVAFQEMNYILEQFGEVGVEKKWSQSITKRLNKAKQYLKTNYKVNLTVRKTTVCVRTIAGHLL